MTAQRTQHSMTRRLSEIGLLASFIIAYGVFSLIVALATLPLIGSFLLASILSYSSVGLLSYVLVDFILPEEMSRVHSRLLHELAKRKLIEFD